MLQPIYSIFSFVYWSFTTTLWIILYLFIIIAIITFIGFINVQFFTKNNAEFTKILKEEQNSSFRFHATHKRQSSSSSSNSDNDQQLDDIDSISTYSSRSRRTRRNRQRKPQQELPEDMQPKWRITKRMKTRERRRYKEDEREQSTGSQSSPSESTHSISRSVSNSISNLKSLQQKNNSQQRLYDDDTNISDNNTNNPNSTKSVQNNSNSIVSPNIDQSTKFNFKLSSRMRSKMIERRNNNINNTDSPNQTDEHEMSTEDQCDEYWKNQRGNRHSHSHEMEDEDNITPKTENGDTTTTERMEFNLERMKTFDNVYDFMERLVLNKIQIEETLRLEIQNCIDGSTLKLKSFEKALLTQKLLEL